MEILLIPFLILTVLFLPGFVLTYTLFDNTKIDYVERTALAFAFSITIISFLAFFTNLSGIKTNIYSIFFIISLVIFLFVSLLLLKMKKYNG